LIMRMRFAAHFASLNVSNHLQSMFLQLSRIMTKELSSTSIAVERQGPAEFVMPVFTPKTPY